MFNALQIATAPAFEPVSVALARQHLRVDHVNDDNLIGAYISAARAWAELYLGRVLAQQQLQWTISQSQIPRGYTTMPLSVLVLPMWFQWPLGQQNSTLELPRQPVISVDAVSFGRWGVADTTMVAGTDYFVDPASASLRFASGMPQSDHLSVLFTAGYGGTADAIPAPISIAILMLVAYLYENRGDAGGDMPAGAERLLTPYRQVTFG